MLRKHARKAITAAVLLLLIAGGFYLFLPTIRAHRMLSQVAGLQVGKSTFAEAQQLAARTGAVADPGCTPTDCNWYRRVDNTALPQFWTGSETSFSVGFRVHNSVVTERGLAEQIGSAIATVAFADVEERSFWTGIPPNPVSIQTQWTAHVPRYSALVMMVPAASPDLHSRYSSFNLSCLWKYHGCANAQELLPTVEWKD